MLAVGLVLAALIGVSLGLLGGGGSILTVPVLVYVLGYAAKPAIVMSLPVVGVTSLVSAIVHWRRGDLQLRMALFFGALAMLGAFAGATLAPLLSGSVQLALLAVVMLAAAGAMLRTGPVSDGPIRRAPRLALMVPVALGVGVLTGVVGIGGGFLVVPALVLFAGVPMREAVGTSLLVIAMNSASAFVGAFGTAPLDWRLLILFTGIAVFGALVGTGFAARVPQATLKRAFAVLLFVMGGFVLYQNRSAFRPVLGWIASGDSVDTPAARRTSAPTRTPSAS